MWCCTNAYCTKQLGLWSFIVMDDRAIWFFQLSWHFLGDPRDTLLWAGRFTQSRLKCAMGTCAEGNPEKHLKAPWKSLVLEHRVGQVAALQMPIAEPRLVCFRQGFERNTPRSFFVHLWGLKTLISYSTAIYLCIFNCSLLCCPAQPHACKNGIDLFLICSNCYHCFVESSMIQPPRVLLGVAVMRSRRLILRVKGFIRTLNMLTGVFMYAPLLNLLFTDRGCRWRVVFVFSRGVIQILLLILPDGTTAG